MKKIFDWVHRKFHNKDVYANNHENVKMINKAEHERGALQLETLDDWGQAGILTIGTFGFDHGPALVNDFNQQVHFHLFQNEEEEKEYEDDVNVPIIHVEHDEDKISTYPLVLNASIHGFGNNINTICTDHEDQNGMKPEITLAVEDAELDEKRACTSRQRVTLADLFSADSQHHTSTQPDNENGKLAMEATGIGKLAADHDPNVKLQFSEKFMKEDSYKHSHPIKKIHRMMTRILKKKIHPELEGKKQKKENETINCAGRTSNEMASLLQTQDAVACA